MAQSARLMAESPSYELIPDFGLPYDSVPIYATRLDVPFYVREAAGVKGAVLELGCGAGRILLPLARAGRTGVGLDSSEQMLARCRPSRAGCLSSPSAANVGV